MSKWYKPSTTLPRILANLEVISSIPTSSSSTKAYKNSFSIKDGSSYFNISVRVSITSILIKASSSLRSSNNSGK